MTPILAHLIGDFLFQNDFMQKKTTSHWHCFVHIIFYTLPFLFTGLLWWQIFLIALQHYLQDRYGWALVWQTWTRQTPADKYPMGRFVVDQVLHIVFITGIASL